MKTVHPRVCLTPKARTRIQRFILALTNLHVEAHACGLNATGQAMHKAVQRSGWEFAELCDKQDRREKRRKLARITSIAARRQ